MRLKLISIIFIFISSIVSAQTDQIHHNLNVKIIPSQSYLSVTDEITIPSALAEKEIKFTLQHALSIKVFSKGVQLEKIKENVTSHDVGMDQESDEPNSELLNEYLLKFKNKVHGPIKIKLMYSGKILSPAEQSSKNYARGFSESPGIISTKGVYLAGSTYWVPYFGNGLVTFNLTTALPLKWKSVTQGKRVDRYNKDNAHFDKWTMPYPQEEIFLIAAKFTEYDYPAGSVLAMAFLRTPDENLANKYLQTTAQYLEMYRKLIGPYPYSKFALVENFWETGYGMPSFTLLGEKIIRFPFILHSSYPHELLHNWWGNSVYVNFKYGNWCEGITVYMADHLIKEQRGQGAVYRRNTLQKYTDYVNSKNDFPLSKFISRDNPSSEAIGYGKALMMWNMLRTIVGDKTFKKGFQNFYRKFKFKRASFYDIRDIFEEVTGKNLHRFFNQWVKRKGAPELKLSNVKLINKNNNYKISFELSQIQKEKPFVLYVPIVIFTSKKAEKRFVKMNMRVQSFEFDIKNSPLKLEIDPQFNLFRRLDYREIPPALSKIFGAEKALIILPSKASSKSLAIYKKLANEWVKEKPEKLEIVMDSSIKSIPQNKSVWIFGWKNTFGNVIKNGIKDYNAGIGNSKVRFGSKMIPEKNHSFIITVRHPENKNEAVAWLTVNNADAVPGLIRKLPHYSKYSYLAFEGEEPTNVAKGQWRTVNSPLSAWIGKPFKTALPKLKSRKALIMPSPVFSAKKMLEHVKFLASKNLKGRGLGTLELEKAADYIENQFEKAGLKPGGDNGTYFENWSAKILGKKFKLKNIIGFIPGKKKTFAKQSVVISAHYDHLGLGWPDVRKGDKGKIHPGADDNASGVSILIELAKNLTNSGKPDRTIVFVAFTGEEEGLVGSKYYAAHYKKFPADKVIADLNLDTVGRLYGKKIFVLGSNSAKEWKFIFMGTDYVTGIPTDLVTQPLDASDQLSFTDRGIPAVQFFSGPNADYHRPTDTANKIDSDGMVKIATVVKEVVQYLSEREAPLTFTGKVSSAKRSSIKVNGKNRSIRKVSTGTIPDFAFTGKGVRIGSLILNSPAEKAGLKKGDIIISLENIEINDLRDYSNALKKYKPGDIVNIKYLRNGKKYFAKLKLKQR